MKAPITLAVLALHAVIITTILVQPGCNSDNNGASEINPEITKAAATGEEMEAVVEDMPPEGSASLRAAPTRPAEKLPGASTGEVVVTEEMAETELIDPIPPAVSTIKPKPAPAQEEAAEIPSPAPASEYVVKSGDNPSKIAKAHGISADELMAANGLTRNSVIRIGQKLTIPAAGSAPAPEFAPAPKPQEEAASGQSETSVYIVQKGDSLSKIAAKHGTSVKRLMSLNGLKKTGIRIGQKLKVPAIGQSVSRAQQPKAAANFAGKKTHTIARGETLGGIAKRYGVSIASIMDANGIKDPRKIRAGQTIIVGESAKAPEVQPTVQPQPKPTAAPEAQSPVKIQADQPAAPAPLQVPAQPAIPQDAVNTLPQANDLPEIQEI